MKSKTKRLVWTCFCKFIITGSGCGAKWCANTENGKHSTEIEGTLRKSIDICF